MIHAGEVLDDGDIMSDTPMPVDNTPTDADFVLTFTEFNNAARYPQPQRALWLNTAISALSPSRWANYYKIGVYLWVAHHLVLFGNQGRRRNAMNPGLPPLIPTSKSVGGVSLGYDTSMLGLSNAGHWALTTYGIRWLDIARMAGAGGDIVGWDTAPQPSFGIPGFVGGVSLY